MTYYRIYQDDDGKYRVRFQGRINLDIGSWDTKIEVENHLAWCRGSRWGKEPLQDRSGLSDLYWK